MSMLDNLHNTLYYDCNSVDVSYKLAVNNTTTTNLNCDYKDLWTYGCKDVTVFIVLTAAMAGHIHVMCNGASHELAKLDGPPAIVWNTRLSYILAAGAYIQPQTALTDKTMYFLHAQ